MFWRLFKTNLRVTLADRPLVFWGVMFPLILGTLFNFAFASLNSIDEFKSIPVAIVDSSAYQSDKNLNMSLGSLTSGDKKILDAKKVSDTDKAISLLNDQEVDAVIESDGSQATITVRGATGFNETIVKTAVEQSIQTTSAIVSTLQKNPEVMTKLGDVGRTNYLNDTTNSDLDRTAIYFYSLIGMACLYAGFFGIYGVNRTQANLTKLGARLSASPISKAQALLSTLGASYVIILGAQLLLYLFLTQTLGIHFGPDTWAVLLVMALGSLAGLALGTLIGAGSTRSENFKTSVLLAGTMIGSMLAGMMGTTSLKYLIDQNAPLLAAINPVNSITDALYATYYFGVGERYWQDILFLSIFAVVSIIGAWLVTRRKTYASL